MRDPIWQFVSTVVAVVALLIAVLPAYGSVILTISTVVVLVVGAWIALSRRSLGQSNDSGISSGQAPVTSGVLSQETGKAPHTSAKRKRRVNRFNFVLGAIFTVLFLAFNTILPQRAVSVDVLALVTALLSLLGLLGYD